MKRSIAGGFTVITVALTLAGCTNKTIGQAVGEKMMEKTIEAQTGAKVNINSTGENVTIKTQEGQTQYSAGGSAKLPNNFPQELIVSRDAKIIVSSTTTSGSSVTYITNDDTGQVSEKYINGLTGAGWKNEMETNTGQGVILNFSKENMGVVVVAGDNDSKDQSGKTTVNITLVIEEKK